MYRKEKRWLEKHEKPKRTTDLPGTIYLNKNRYWWKVNGRVYNIGIVAGAESKLAILDSYSRWAGGVFYGFALEKETNSH